MRDSNRDGVVDTQDIHDIAMDIGASAPVKVTIPAMADTCTLSIASGIFEAALSEIQIQCVTNAQAIESPSGDL